MLEAAGSIDRGKEQRRAAARLAFTATTLLLRAPDERIRSQLCAAAGTAAVPPLAVLRQSFYDRFCIPQSGLYIPPFEHVFRRRDKAGQRWHFPPARHGAAQEVEAVYARFGFWHTALDADPILSAPHLPGDHLGFMLAFVAWVLQGTEREEAMPTELFMQVKKFIASHLDGWVEDYCELLEASEPHGYPAAVGAAVSEAVAEVRQAVAQA